MSDEEIGRIKRQLLQYCDEEHPVFDSILDHLACQIEDNKSDQTFDQKLIIAWNNFSASEVQEIQKQINTYTHMKTQKLVNQGLIYSMIVSIGTMFTGMAIKIAHGPGALAFILLSLLTATLVVLPLVMIKTYQQEVLKLSKWNNITLVVSILLFCTGVFFKISHWPGATVLMLSGIGSFCLLYWPFSFIEKWKTAENRWTVLLHHMLMILVALMIFGLFKV